MTDKCDAISVYFDCINSEIDKMNEIYYKYELVSWCSSVVLFSVTQTRQIIELELAPASLAVAV